MTIKECIDNVDNIKPNQYGTKEKVLWLSFLDETIINDVLKTHEGYDGRYDEFTGYTEDKLTVTLIVPSPYDRLYTAYLKMKIDSENGETARYNNSVALFNTYMMEYRKYYNKTHLPLDVTSKRNVTPPKKATVGLTDTEFENLKRELYYLLSEDVNEATSPDKINKVISDYVSVNAAMLKGKDGVDGKDGKDGYTPRKNVDYFDGEKGEAFTYDDFTPAQLSALKGEKGDKGDKGDQGERGVQGILGIKGDKGEQGFTGPQGAKGDKGDKGDPFTYEDFTKEQLEALKGEKGDKGDKGDRGEKGDPFTYEDFTNEQLEALKIANNFGSENANKILAIDDMGKMIPIHTGEGLEINKIEISPLVNLYDHSTCIYGKWYIYRVSSDKKIELQENQYTGGYQAIAIPLPKVPKITLSAVAPGQPNIYRWFIADADDVVISVGDAGINHKLRDNPLILELPEGATTLYLSTTSVNTASCIMANVGESVSPYVPFNGTPEAKTVLDIKNTIELSLPTRYELVVGDTFELFWNGIVKCKNIEDYYIEAVCSKGSPFRKRFIYTPSASDVGEHLFTVSIYDKMHTLLASGQTTLSVKNKATSPTSDTVVLYVGDSLANGGHVPDEFHRRLTATDGTPVGDGLSNISFIGTCESNRNKIPYEGYGGYSWSNYNTESKSYSFMWITASAHGKTIDDQHSIYTDSNGIKWKLETIEADRLKLIRTSSSGTLPSSGTLTWVSGGVNTANIVYTASALAAGNPFWNEETGVVDFLSYVQAQGKTSLNYLYVLLGWNGKSASDEDIIADALTFINNVHDSFPNCRVVLLGIQMPAPDGLAANYGASETWTYFSAMSHVIRLNRVYAEIAETTPNVSFIQVSGQFDTENNMPTSERTVNVRSGTKEKYQSNGVHPTGNGYYQIADACYRDFVHKIQ